MRKTFAALAAAGMLVLGGPTAATAQIPGIDIGFAGGPTYPLGSLGDEASTGFHLRGSFGLEVPLLPIGARADLLWQRFPYPEDGAVTTLGGLLNGTLRMPLPLVRPYLIGGVGYMRHDEPETQHGDHAHAGETYTDFAFAVGAGIGLRLLGFGGFVEARYLDWGHGNRSVPLTLGFTF
jgi:hypothetical protein